MTSKTDKTLKHSCILLSLKRGSLRCKGLVLRQQSNNVDGKVKDEKLSLKGFDKGHIRTL